MPYFMVWGSEKRPVMFGGSFLDWSSPPIGVFQADDVDSACKVAAKEHGRFGTFFAIEGTPWGLELLTAEAAQLGKEGSPTDRLAATLERMEKMQDVTAQLLLEKAKERDV